MSDFVGLFSVREGKDSDKNFILSTFLRGLYYGDSWFSLIPKDIFMDNYKEVVAHLVNSPNSVIKVACLNEDPEVILGYSVLSSDYQTIHWVYVKKMWRNKGIAKTLVPSRPVSVTHLSLLGRQLLVKYKDTVFNPFYKE